MQISKHFKKIIKNISKEIFGNFFCLVKIHVSKGYFQGIGTQK